MKPELTGHARTLSLTEMEAGQTWREEKEITGEMLKAFIEITQDRALAHVDSEHCTRMGFDRCIVHGLLVGSGYSRILGMFLPGSNTVIHKVQLEMLSPVFVGDVLTYEVRVDRVIPAVRSVQLKLAAMNQEGKLVNQGTAVCTFRA